MVVIRIQNSNNSLHVTIPVTPSQCKGGKEKSITPEKDRGEPLTGILVVLFTSIPQPLTKCNTKPGHDLR